MSRNFEDLELEIIEIEPFSGPIHKGIIIKWDSNIGFGEYTLFRDKRDGTLFADSESMDKDEDKSFLETLLMLALKKTLDEAKIV